MNTIDNTVQLTEISEEASAVVNGGGVYGDLASVRPFSFRRYPGPFAIDIRLPFRRPSFLIGGVPIYL